MTRSDQIKAQISRTRFAIEKFFFPDPFFLAADRKYTRQGITPDAPPPDWLARENAILVPWMTGFRMSYRTDVIRNIGFNEHLGRYALFEDTAASLAALDTHLLVGARNAQIYHHKTPARRANGRALGAMQILNRAYVLAMAGETDSALRRSNKRFAQYKIAQYRVSARTEFGRDRLAGALAASRVMMGLFDASPEAVTSHYLELRAACFDSE